MPTCYKCDQPVIFIPTINGDAISEKSIPVNVNPDNANGTIALFQWPVLFKGTRPTKGEFMTVGRRIYSVAAEMLIKAGGSLYRIHWDTCRGNQNNYGNRRRF